MLSDDPGRNQNFMKPYQDFGVRRASDFVTWLLPQGAWARCISCQDDRRGALGKELGKELGGDTNNLPKDERKEFGKLGKEFGKLGGKLGGNTNNSFIKERSLAASQACETCTQCSRLLTSKSFWPEDWRHRTKPDLKITCKECCPTPPKERLPGWVARSRKNSIEAAARPITCQACARNLPRTQFRPNRSKGKFDFRKPQTCEQCRAEGKHPTSGPKRMRSA